MMDALSQPATPSKSKLPGRRGFCSLTTLLVVFALVAGAPRPGGAPGGRGCRGKARGALQRTTTPAVPPPLLPLAAARAWRGRLGRCAQA